MVKPRFIDKIDKSYSDWHRELGNDYLMIDIDSLEIREKKIVAIIDYTGRLKDENHLINSKRFIWDRTILQRKILTDLSNALKVPCYFVIHTTDLKIFHVHNLNLDLTEFKRFTENQYATFFSL